jgi:hypothetical protein
MGGGDKLATIANWRLIPMLIGAADTNRPDGGPKTATERTPEGVSRVSARRRPIPVTVPVIDTKTINRAATPALKALRRPPRLREEPRRARTLTCNEELVANVMERATRHRLIPPKMVEHG